MAVKVYQVQAEVSFITTVQVTTSATADSHEVCETFGACVNNLYGYLVDDPDKLSYSAHTGLAEVDVVETRIKNLFIADTQFLGIEGHEGNYILYTLGDEMDEDYRLLIPVENTGMISETDRNMWRMARLLVEAEYKYKKENDDLAVLFSL